MALTKSLNTVLKLDVTFESEYGRWTICLKRARKYICNFGGKRRWYYVVHNTESIYCL